MGLPPEISKTLTSTRRQTTTVRLIRVDGKKSESIGNFRNAGTLQERAADRYGRHVKVCHDSTGASMGNLVEHRLFALVSNHGAGQPPRSVEVLLGWVRATEAGGVGVTASDEEMRGLDLERHEVCPDWNSTIGPRHSEPRNSQGSR